ncbi:conserved hypothetical protein [Ricinus communis]|uniref:Uncharacterized protein n=1 Tax=Ricinus communis TaxID=3988 RepID=B9S2L6_RICCO|nr:conserved hypothetical protein [Ricinus communis]
MVFLSVAKKLNRFNHIGGYDNGLIVPYLFILCAEGFSAGLRKNETMDMTHGCRIDKGAPMVSHLFFANDSLSIFSCFAY